MNGKSSFGRKEKKGCGHADLTWVFFMREKVEVGRNGNKDKCKTEKMGTRTSGKQKKWE